MRLNTGLYLTNEPKAPEFTDEEGWCGLDFASVGDWCSLVKLAGVGDCCSLVNFVSTGDWYSLVNFTGVGNWCSLVKLVHTGDWCYLVQAGKKHVDLTGWWPICLRGYCQHIMDEGWKKSNLIRDDQQQDPQKECCCHLFRLQRPDRCIGTSGKHTHECSGYRA
jgi:hypothetical protein